MRTRAAAKGRRLFFIAAVCLASALLLSPAAEASRSLPAAIAPVLEAPATPGQILEAELTEPPERLRLFDDLRLPPRPLELVEARKTASGSSTYTLGLNVWQTGGLGRIRGGLSFQGLWHDPLTGIAYARNRWYDARTAHWLSPDPMGAFDSPNQYAFVAWGPHMYTDPTGEFAFIPVLLWGIGGGLTANFAINAAADQIDEATTEDPHANIWLHGGLGAGKSLAVDAAVGLATGGGWAVGKSLYGGAKLLRAVRANQHTLEGYRLFREAYRGLGLTRSSGSAHSFSTGYQLAKTSAAKFHMWNLATRGRAGALSAQKTLMAPLRGSSSHRKGRLGESLSLMRLLGRREHLVGRHVPLMVEGVELNLDLLSVTRRARGTRYIESKFGPSAGLSSGQRVLRLMLAEGPVQARLMLNQLAGREARERLLQLGIDVTDEGVFRLDAMKLESYFGRGYRLWDF